MIDTSLLIEVIAVDRLAIIVHPHDKLMSILNECSIRLVLPSKSSAVTVARSFVHCSDQGASAKASH